ncbi:response regulator transcription factor [Phycicoccus endophyticus]|uniref:response regulator transcription factor n=1 Tax=Phycicoccus endophyticus TaxID=1690220 RepID=UPI00197C4F6D|nr:response regulator transcription factor [Phycicoccus endophyticus]GGL28761.1 DNA-binding response regulator [Phycicoccus endophyticus]
MTISVVLVDDHAVVREAVAGMLGSEEDIRVVGQAGSLAEGRALFERLLRTPPPGRVVAVIDVTMPDGSGLALVRSVRASSTEIGLVVLTMLNDDSTLLEALDAGASALVRKSAPADQVLSAVRRAADFPLEFSATGLAEAMRRRQEAPQASLTARESEVLTLLVEGASVAQVGRQLYMSPSTVKTHIGRIYEKLGAHNRASAVIAAVRLGLVADVDR